MEPKSNIRRKIGSWLFTIFQIAFGLLHLKPSLAYRIGSTSTTYIVGYINSLGPYWVVLFVLSGLFTAYTLLRKDGWCWIGHLFCGAILAGYTAALYVGALGDSPHGPLTYPTMSLVITSCHAMLMHSYGGDR